MIPDNSSTVPNSSTPLLLNSIFQRLAKIQVFKEALNPYGVKPYFGERRSKTFLPRAEALEMDQTLKEIEKSLRSAVPYQLLSNATTTNFDDPNIRIPNDLVLPHPVMWIDNLSVQPDDHTLSGTFVSGIVLVDEGRDRIRLTLIAEQADANYSQKALLGDIRSGSAYKLLSRFTKKFSSFRSHTMPMFMVPNIIFDKNEGSIFIPDDGITPIIFESSEKIPFIINGTEDIKNNMEAAKISSMRKDWMAIVKKSLLLANAIQTSSPDIAVNSAPLSTQNEEAEKTAERKIPVRQASTITINSNSARTVPVETEINQDVVEVGERIQPDSSDLLLNGIFQKFAKLRVWKKRITTVSPYMSGASGNRFKPEEAAARLDRHLVKTEGELRAATPYKFRNSTWPTLRINDDIELPSSITWLEAGTDKGGALLIDNGRGEISVTIFFEQPRDIKEPDFSSSLPKDYYRRMGPLIERIAAIGDNREPLIVFPNMIFDKKQKIYLPVDTGITTSLISETKEGYVLVSDYEEAKESFYYDDAIRTVKDKLLVAADKFLLLANAIAKGHPGIVTDLLPRPKPAGDRTAIQMGKPIKRMASLVSINPHYIENSLANTETVPTDSAPSEIAAAGTLPDGEILQLSALTPPNETAISADAIAEKEDIPYSEQPESETQLIHGISLANLVVETGRYATGIWREAIRPIGRELMSNPKSGKQGTRQFVIDANSVKLLGRDFGFEFDDFAGRHNEIRMPFDSMWIEDTVAESDSQRELQRTGNLIQKSDGTITLRYAVEMLFPVDDKSRREYFAGNLGASFHEDRLIFSDGGRINIREGGKLTLTRGPSFHAFKEVMPKTEFERYASASAVAVLRFLVFISSKNVETNIWDYVNDQDNGGTNPEEPKWLWLRLSDDVEKALEAGDIKTAKELLGWADQTAQNPVNALQTTPSFPTPNNTTPSVNRLIRPTWAEDKAAASLNMASEFIPRLEGETVQIEGGIRSNDLTKDDTRASVSPNVVTNEASGTPNKTGSRSPIINGVFHRLALVRLSKKIQPLPFPYTVDPAHLEFLPVGTAKRMDQILTEAEQKLRFAMPYQFSADAASIIIPEDSLAITKDSHLPSPVTWIEWIVDSNLINSVGVLLVEDKQEKIRATVFLSRDLGDKTSFDADNQDVPSYMKPQLRKIAAVGYYKNPLMIISDIAFNLNEGTLTMPNDESITLAIGQRTDGVPIVTDRRGISGTVSKEQTAGFNEDIRLYAEIALAFANALATGDQRIQATAIAKPRPSDDGLAIKLGKAPQRTVSVVTLNPDYAISNSYDVDHGGDSEKIALATQSLILPGDERDEISLPSVTPVPSMLNGIFQGYAKMRVLEKLTGRQSYFVAGTRDHGHMPKAMKASIGTLLQQSENMLRLAAPYSVSSGFFYSLLNADDVPDFTLPAAKTWIEEARAGEAQGGRTGVLLVDRPDSISITIFIRNTKFLPDDLEQAETLANHFGEREFNNLPPDIHNLVEKMKIIGPQLKPMLVIPNIVFEKKTQSITASDNITLLPLIFETPDGAPLICDYTPFLDALVKLRAAVPEIALRALHVSHAISSKNPSLLVQEVRRAKFQDDEYKIRLGEPVMRDVAQVTPNPDFIPEQQAEVDQKPDTNLSDLLEQQEVGEESLSSSDTATITEHPKNSGALLQSSLLNSVFERLAKIYVAKRGNVDLPIYEVGFQTKIRMSRARQSQVDEILSRTQTSLRAASGYHFAGDATYFAYLEAIEKDFDFDIELPARTTWLESASRNTDMNGALLVDRADGTISITLIHEETSSPKIPSDNAELPDMLEKTSGRYRKTLRRINEISDPQPDFAISPGIIFDKKTKQIILPKRETIRPYVEQLSLGIPLIHDATVLVDSDAATKKFEDECRSFAGSALILANAVAKQDPRLKFETASQPNLGADIAVINSGRPVKRDVSFVEINLDYVENNPAPEKDDPSTSFDVPAPNTLTEITTEQIELDKSDALTETIQIARDLEGSPNDPQLRADIPNVEESAPAVIAESKPFSAMPEVDNSAIPDAVNPPPLYLNKIFQRFAKIRVLKKLLPSKGLIPYIRNFGSTEPMTSTHETRLNQILGQTERSLRFSRPYQIQSGSILDCFNDLEAEIPADLTLPHEITWIDNIPEKLNEEVFPAGTLLIDNGKNISLTLFFDVPGAMHPTSTIDAISQKDLRQRIMSFMKRIEPLGKHEVPTFIFANITYDKVHGTISISNNDLLPVFVDFFEGYPMIVNGAASGINIGAVTEITDGSERFAKSALLISNAIAKKDPRIAISFAPKPNRSNDFWTIKMGRAHERQASIVSVNPEFNPEAETLLTQAGSNGLASNTETETVHIERHIESSPSDLELKINAPDVETVEPTVISEPEPTEEVNEEFGTAVTEEGVRQAPVVITSIIAAEQSEDPSKSPSGTSVSDAPIPTLQMTEEEKLENAIKRIDALKDARVVLQADAEMYLAQAQNRGLNHFDCSIILSNPGSFPIQLNFSGKVNIEGETKVRNASFVLDGHMRVFESYNISPTLGNAVDLKIDVQNMISNVDGIIPTSNTTTSGQRTVELETQIPLPILGSRHGLRSNGTYYLALDGLDPWTRKTVQTAIPLGLAAERNDEAEKCELYDRMQFVVGHLNEQYNYRTSKGKKVIVTKRDALMRLESYLGEQGKPWATAEYFDLPGYEKSTLIYASFRGDQKITMGQVVLRLDMGGDNPSWHCGLPFYIGDKNKAPLGTLVRTRTINLQTRSAELAIARSRESLRGVQTKEGAQKIEGFLQILQRHMRSTGDEWRVENKGTDKEQVYIGDVPLQHFLDDMMRYDYDIGIKLERRVTNDDGSIDVTIQALRCLTPDHGGATPFSPESIYESDNEARKQMAFTFKIPANHGDKIESFVQAAHEHVRWHADEAYSSIAISPDGENYQRKKPRRFRTAQIRLGIIRAVEALYEVYFDHKLPRNWHKSKTEFACSAEVATDRKAHHAQPQFLIPFARENFVRHAQPDSRSNLVLG